VVGITDAFAPLDPDTPFAIVDVASFGLHRFAQLGATTLPDEWWLTVRDGAEPAVLDAVSRAGLPIAEAIGRDERAAALARDPVPLGVIGVLGLGSFAAMTFAAVGFVVSATVSTTERLGEFALLRALGLSARELAVWLSLENVFLLAVGLLAGTGLGLLLAWLVLPFATLTQTGAAPVPTPVVVVPIDGIVPPYVLALVLFAITVVIVRRQLPAIRISDVLRGRDE
jgi:ABC-type antimicrobial peptide transport system permease subunit